MIEWARIITIIIGLFISIPVFFIGNTIRFFKKGKKLFHVKTRTDPPKCLLDTKYGDHKYMKVNGVKIHYVESGDVKKPLLLFVHGWPQFWFVWRNQIEYFNKNYHVVAMDMRGYNDSEKPVGIKNYMIGNMVQDIRELVIGLNKEKFTLIGHDWGGVVSWGFARTHPEMLENLILCNMPHLKAFSDARKESWEQALKSWYIVFFQTPVMPELNMLADDMAVFNLFFRDVPSNKDPEILEAYKYAYKDFKTWNRTINYYRGTTFKEGIDWMEKGDWTIKVRTLQIFGTGDTAISVTPAKNSSKYVPDYTLELLDGVSHWVQEQEPERVNKLIENFIK